MSFKREEIRGILGDAYTDDIAKSLVDLHRTVVDPLMDQLDTAKQDAARYKADAEKLPAVQKELDTLKGGKDWKSEYEKEHRAFEDYKTSRANEEKTTKVKAAYRKLLTDERVSEKAIESILNATDYSKMELKDDGTLDKVEDIKKDIDTKWGGFKVAQRARGERVDTPPPGSNNDGGNSDVRKMASAWHAQRFGAPAQPAQPAQNNQ